MKAKSLREEYLRRFDYLRKNYREFDPSSMRLFFSLFYAGIVLRGALEKRMRSYGLTGPAFGVMTLLETMTDRSLPMNEIGRRTWVTPANVTGVVDTLERKGLVTRRRGVKDRRVTLVGLTPKGRSRLAGVLPRHFAFIRGMFRRVRAGEKGTFLRLLSRFNEGAGA